MPTPLISTFCVTKPDSFSQSMLKVSWKYVESLSGLVVRPRANQAPCQAAMITPPAWSARVEWSEVEQLAWGLRRHLGAGVALAQG